MPVLNSDIARSLDKLADLLELEGANPFRIRAYRNAARVVGELPRTVGTMMQAGENLAELPGFGAKTEERVLKEAEKRAAAAPRIKRLVADDIAKPLLAYLTVAAGGAEQATIAGSYRRCKETVGDLDIVAAAPNGRAVIERFIAYEDVAQILSRGRTRSSVVLRNGTQVDLRVVSEANYGAALQYLTGSKAHNIALRQIAAARGLKRNEYGLFRGKRRVAGRTEAEIYAYLGLPYIEPELREDHGEIDAAREGRLPHPGLGLPRDKQTDRLRRAIDNPCLAVLAHPIGRLIGEREGCDFDVERVLRHAQACGCAIEINGQPDRLDLDEWHAKLAKELGVKLVLSSDAHSPVELGFMRYAVDQARRGWLEPGNILNTARLDPLKASLRCH